MTVMTEAALIEKMRDLYRHRLRSLLGEVKLRDDAGNIIVSPGLKVRHSETGFEYTVDSVSEDPGTNQVNVTLKKPEVPRFNPPGEEFVGESDGLSRDDTEDSQITHVDRLINSFGDSISGSEDESNVTFVVNQQEFEQDYDLEMSDAPKNKQKKTNSGHQKDSPEKVKKTTNSSKQPQKGSKR